MAAGLYPTKTRLALLRSVAAGEVLRTAGIGTRLFDHLSPGGLGDIGATVTGRIAELQRAGWVELHETAMSTYWTRRVWHLTAAGRAVLDAAGERAS